MGQPCARWAKESHEGHLPRDNTARVQVTMPTYFVLAAYSVSPCHARGGIRDQRHIQLVQKSLTQKSILKSWHRHSHLFAWPLTRRRAAMNCGTCATLTGGPRCSTRPRRVTTGFHVTCHARGGIKISFHTATTDTTVINAGSDPHIINVHHGQLSMMPQLLLFRGSSPCFPTDHTFHDLCTVLLDVVLPQLLEGILRLRLT